MPPTLRPLLRNLPTIAPVPHRSLLYLSGSQASEFLNGVLASSVPNPAKGPFFSTFLHAQGRVLYDIFVYPKKSPKGHDGYYIEYDSRTSEAPPMVPFLKRYILRSKVKVENVSAEYEVWAAWGSEDEGKWETERKWNWARSGAIEPNWVAEDEWPWGNECVLRDRRAVGMGKRMVVRKGERPHESASHDVARPDDYTLHRIMHGVPEGIIDIPPMQAFPMESNLDVMGALDFRKGCYVGQELTVRTYHTGAVRKRILPVQIHARDPSSGDATTLKSASVKDASMPLEHCDIRAVVKQPAQDSQSRPRPRGTSKLLSTSQGVGLALLRLEHVEGAERGNLTLQAEIGDGEQERRCWSVSPWWPDWWPHKPSDQ